MITFTIHAFRDGETMQTARISPTKTVAKARSLQIEGWVVHVTDSVGREYRPEAFDDLLRFDR